MIGTVYCKNDVMMITHILTNLPKVLYKEFVTTLRVLGYSSMSMQDFKEKIQDYWKMNIKQSRQSVKVLMHVKKDRQGKTSMSNERAAYLFERFKDMLIQEE